MSKTLDQFVLEMQQKLVSFKNDWIEDHKNDPESFPLELPDNQIGLWDEFFSEYIQTERLINETY